MNNTQRKLLQAVQVFPVLLTLVILFLTIIEASLIVHRTSTSVSVSIVYYIITAYFLYSILITSAWLYKAMRK